MRLKYYDENAVKVTKLRPFLVLLERDFDS